MMFSLQANMMLAGIAVVIGPPATHQFDLFRQAEALNVAASIFPPGRNYEQKIEKRWPSLV